MRVSVVIPTYNRADYLKEALCSVKAQTHSPFEIIVVDDGSTDQTETVVNNFDHEIRCLRRNHEGVAAARSAGVTAAQGDILAWLDADDLWEPTFLKTVIQRFVANPEIDGVYTGLNRIDGTGHLLPQSSTRVVPPDDLYHNLIEGCLIQTSTFAVRKACFDEVGLFDRRFDICEDYDMFLRLAAKFSLVGIPKALVKYRVHAHNTVKNTDVFCRDRLALSEKHFGSFEGDPRTWHKKKRRAHAFAWRAVGLRYLEIRQYDQGWHYLHAACQAWPNILDRLDTFYELVCYDQPAGHRGHTAGLDIKGNGETMLQGLNRIFADATSELASMRDPAYGNAYLTLALLSDQAGAWVESRRYLLQAIRCNPRLLRLPLVMRKGLKLWLKPSLTRIGDALHVGTGDCL